MMYNVNGSTVEIIRKAAKTTVKAMRRHNSDFMVHFDGMEGYNITTNIDGMNLTTYNNGHTWFILDSTSGIAVSQANTYKNAVDRFVNFLNNNGIDKALSMIDAGRADVMEKWSEYIAVE